MDDDLADLLRQIDEEGDPHAVETAPEIGSALTKPTEVTRPERAEAAVIESEGGIEFEPEFASFGARAGGLAVDALVLFALTLPGGIALISGSAGLIALGALLIVIGFAIGTVLYARAVASSGQSIGNRAAGTKVVDARNGSIVSAGTAGLRYVIRFLVSPIFFVGFLMALFNTQRRTFHDDMAGTVVTRPPRATWSIDDDVSP